MKKYEQTRIRTYYQFGIFKFYNIQALVDNGWTSIAKTTDHDKSLAMAIKKLITK